MHTRLDIKLCSHLPIFRLVSWPSREYLGFGFPHLWKHRHYYPSTPTGNNPKLLKFRWEDSRLMFNWRWCLNLIYSNFTMWAQSPTQTPVLRLCFSSVKHWFGWESNCRLDLALSPPWWGQRMFGCTSEPSEHRGNGLLKLDLPTDRLTNFNRPPWSCTVAKTHIDMINHNGFKCLKSKIHFQK